MKKLLCTLAAASLMATSFAGCGKDKDSKSSGGSDLKGKWECTEMTSGGMTITEVPFIGAPVSALFQLEFKDDGTFSITSGIVGGEENGVDSDDEFGKWEKVDDNTVKLKVEPDADDSSDSGEIREVTGKLDGETFVMEYEEDGSKSTVKFKRVTEFSTFIMTTMDPSSISVEIGDSDIEGESISFDDED